MNTLRPELPEPTARIAKLPIDRGYPVPWFVTWLIGDEPTYPDDPYRVGTHHPDAKPEFRVMRPNAVAIAHRDACCWICGERLGAHRSFVLGPMCAINHTSGEPPSHRDCATWAAKACPFLTRPHARRRDDGLPNKTVAGGIMIPRNPGVALVWTTRQYELRHVPNGVLFDIGDPHAVEWYCEGRPATRDEVLHSIDTGLPILREACDQDKNAPRAHQALDDAYDEALTLVPA